MRGVLPFEVYYENSLGERLYLDRRPCVISGGTLFDTKWKPQTSSRPMGEGLRLLSAKRPSEDKTMELDVYADTQEELADVLENMETHFGRDISAMSCGRLYIGDQFLRCMCMTSKKELSRDFVMMGRLTLTVLTEIPAWCRETTYRHLPGGDMDADGHKYSYGYPYRYGTGMAGITIYNESYLPSPLRIVFYGPAVSPRVEVNGSVIGINTTLLEGEYAVIDQQMRQIYKVSADGGKTNIFDSRVKNGRTYEYIRPGAAHAGVTSDAGVDITVIEQRSEPRWALS